MRLRAYLTSLTRSELDELMNECNLTEEEEDVFKCLAKGKSNVATADVCKCSVATISNRINHILFKVKKVTNNE